MRETNHRYRANHNYQFLQELESNNCSYYEWLGIIVFYVALHHVRAKLARTIRLFRKKIGHEDLNRHVSSHFNSNVASKYIFLYEESRRLRYDLRRSDVISQSDYQRYKDILLNTIFPATA